MAKKTREELIQQIMNEFDFAKVHLYMTAVDWHWGHLLTKDDRVPTIDELKECALDLLTRGGGWCTGGFETIDRWEDQGYMRLSFSIETTGRSA